MLPTWSLSLSSSQSSEGAARKIRVGQEDMHNTGRVCARFPGWVRGRLISGAWGVGTGFQVEAVGNFQVDISSE